MKSVVIVGLGSAHGDDRAGWLVIDELRALGAPLERVQYAAHAAQVLDHCERDTRLIVCDACRGSTPPGTLAHWHWPDQVLPSDVSRGTHDLSLADALALGHAAGQSPTSAEVWGLYGECFDAAAAVSPAVTSAARELARELWREWFQA